MPITLSKNAEAVLDAAMASGSFPTREAAVEAALELLATREQKLAWLRSKVQGSLERGGSHSWEEVEESIDATLDEWERKRNGSPKAAE